MAKKNSNELVSNRKALHNYEVIEKFEAGIILVGTEIKSLRDHGGHLQEAYVTITGDEAILKNCSIAPYRFGNVHNHEERRERKLLLHNYEIAKIKRATKEKGLTLIPLSLYLVRGRAKVSIAVARGKKAHDKREAIKAREQKRSIERILKEH